jgi:hypothetical protein
MTNVEIAKEIRQLTEKLVWSKSLGESRFIQAKIADLQAKDGDLMTDFNSTFSDESGQDGYSAEEIAERAAEGTAQELPEGAKIRDAISGEFGNVDRSSGQDVRIWLYPSNARVWRTWGDLTAIDSAEYQQLQFDWELDHPEPGAPSPAAFGLHGDPRDV